MFPCPRRQEDSERDRHSFAVGCRPGSPEAGRRPAATWSDTGRYRPSCKAILIGSLAFNRRTLAADERQQELTDLETKIEAAGRARTTTRVMTADPIRVLFVSTGNSARSQIAEALLNEFSGSDFAVVAAGTEPGLVNPQTVAVLAELGLDWSRAVSKSVPHFVGRPFDYVITVCDRARKR